MLTPRVFRVFVIAWLALAGVVSLRFVLHPAEAQGNRISYGETADSTISAPNVPETWFFDGGAGDIITISILGIEGDLQPGLSLFGPDDALLVQVEQPPAEGEQGTTVTTSLRASGSHTLTITGGNGTTGSYSLSLTLDQPGDLNLDSENTLIYGRSRIGEIDDETFRQFWTFSGLRNDVVDVLMTAQSGDLDSYVGLITPGGEVLVGADVGGSGQDAALYGVQLPSTGTYTIVARRAGRNFGETGTTQGKYELLVSLRKSGSDSVISTPRSIAPGQARPGRLTANAPVAYFRLEATGALAIRLELTNPSRLATISLVTPEGARLQSFSGFDVINQGLWLPDQEELWLEVASPGQLDAAPLDFQLSMYQLPQVQQRPNAIQYGQSRRIYTDDPSSRTWYFVGQQGDLVRIDLAPFSPVSASEFKVLSPSGSPLIVRQIRGPVTQTLVLQESGAYQLLVPALAEGFQLTIEREGIIRRPFAQRQASVLRGPLPAETVTGVLEGPPSHTWYVDIPRPSTWHFQLSSTDGDTQPPLTILVQSPGDETLGVATTRSFSNTTDLFVTFPHEGRYTVVVSDLSGQSGRQYTLSARLTEGGELHTGEIAKGILTSAANYDIWQLQAPADAALGLDIKTIPENISPDIHIVGPDGLLVASTRMGNSMASIDLGTVRLDEGGQYHILVAANERVPRLVYYLEAHFASKRLVPPEMVTTSFVLPQQTTTGALAVRQVDIGASVSAPESLDLSSIPNAGLATIETLLRGEIVAGSDYQRWTLPASKGQIVGIWVTAFDGQVSPDLYVLDRQGNVIAEHRATSGETGYLVHQFEAAANYTILVSKRGGGRYTLWIDSLSGVDLSVPHVIEGKLLAYGDTLAAVLLRDEERRLFIFEGHAGDRIFANVIPFDPELETTLALQNIDGEVLVTASAGLPVPSIEYSLPSDGLYMLAVSRNKGAGMFSIHLNLVESTESAAGEASPIINARSTGQLSATNPRERRLFYAQAGEAISVRLSPGASGWPVPLSLMLADTGGHVFSEARLHVGLSELVLSDQMIPRTGVYQVIVEGGQQTAGSFTLALARNTAGVVDTTRALNYGVTRGGVLAVGDLLDTWAFAGTKDDVVTISVRNVYGDQAPISIQLRTNSGEVLATEVSENGKEAVMRHVTLPISGHYIVVVGIPDSSFAGQTAYSVTARLEHTFAHSMGEMLEGGEVVRGGLSANDPVDTWLLEAHAGQVLNIRLALLHGDILPSVDLASTDWHLASTNRVVTVLATAQTADGEAVEFSYEIAADGVYALVVREPFLNRGSYELSLATVTEELLLAKALRPAQPSTGEIGPAAPTNTWRIPVDSPSHISVSVVPDSRSQLIPALTVMNAAGQPLARASVGVRDGVSIENYALPGPGEYVIQVSAADGAAKASGQYVIELQQVPSEQVTAGTIDFSRPVQGAIDSDISEQVWVFTGEKGSVVSVEATASSSALDPTIELRDAAGRLLAHGDDDLEQADPQTARIIYTLPDSGAFSVIVRRYDYFEKETRGNYVLRLRKKYEAVFAVPEINLAYGDKVTGTVDSRVPVDQWSFVGAAGDTISTRVEFSLDDAPLLLALHDATGNLLADGARVRNVTQINEYVLPAAGIYTLEIKRPLDATQPFNPYVLDLRLLKFDKAQHLPEEAGLFSGKTGYGQFLPDETVHTWFFTAEEGDTIGLALTSLKGSLPDTLILRAPDNTAVFTETIVKLNCRDGVQDTFAKRSDP